MNAEKCFNKELINKVSIFKTQLFVDEIIEDKYAFLEYVFSNLESRDPADLNVDTESFPQLNVDIDAYFKDEDSGVYEVYIAIFDEYADDQTVAEKSEIKEAFDKVVNFLTMVFSSKYYNLDENSETYEIAKDISMNIRESDSNVVINLVTNKRVPVSYKRDGLESINGFNVAFRTYDLDDLHIKFSELDKDSYSIDCKEKFGRTISALKISGNPDFDVYLLAMKGLWLARLYKEDSLRLLEPNVRSYLKRTSKVNAGILETIQNEPKEFVSYNNGISAVGTGIAFADDGNQSALQISSILNFQIVNGGQTSATLAETLKEEFSQNLNGIDVPVKLTIVKNLSKAADLITNISTFSNTQTAIKKSDPPSNTSFFKAYKDLSRQTASYNQDGSSFVCYFERTNGEYDTELRRNNSSSSFKKTNPKAFKFTKIDLAMAIDCWQQLPYKAALGKEKNFSFFFGLTGDSAIMPTDAYFKKSVALVILYRFLDKLAGSLGLSYKNNVVAYSLSLSSLHSNKHLDLLRIWETKTIQQNVENYFRDVMPKVHSVIANPPAEHPEPRMWARKENCWSEVKKITSGKSLPMGEFSDFFPANKALLFINDENNLYDASLWITLLLWDGKLKILSPKQVQMVRWMKTMADHKSNKLTQKQLDYAKGIFCICVQNGFDYLDK